MKFIPKYLCALDIKLASLKVLLIWIEEKILDFEKMTDEEKTFLTERLEIEIEVQQKQIEDIQHFLILAKNPEELLRAFHNLNDEGMISGRTEELSKKTLSTIKDFRLKDLTLEGILKIEAKLKRLCLLKDSLVEILKEISIDKKHR